MKEKKEKQSKTGSVSIPAVLVAQDRIAFMESATRTFNSLRDGIIALDAFQAYKQTASLPTINLNGSTDAVIKSIKSISAKPHYSEALDLMLSPLKLWKVDQTREPNGLSAKDSQRFQKVAGEYREAYEMIKITLALMVYLGLFIYATKDREKSGITPIYSVYKIDRTPRVF